MSRTIAEETIHIFLQGAHRPLERSLEQAYDQAIFRFGIDEDGHSEEVAEWERSCCSIEIEFQRLIFSGGMGGSSTIVIYKATCQRVDDDE